MSSSPDTKSDGAPPQDSPSNVVVFASQGDTRLLVKTDGVNEVFVVSSQVMCLACDAWSRMLDPNGHFKEAQPTADGMKEVELPDDKDEALAILLNIAHLRFDQVPKTLRFWNLFDIAVLTDKYGITKLVEPWIQKWLKDAQHTVNKPGYEKWLWIAWELGDAETFNKFCGHLVENIHMYASGPPPSMNGLFPPGIVESILNVRANVIDDLLNLCYKYVKKYEKSTRIPVCKQLSNRKACDALIYGQFLLQLRNMGFTEPRETSATMPWSITTLEHKLMSISLETFPQVGFMAAHHQCSFQDEFRSSIQIILANIPSAVLDHHKVHIERQYTILHPADP